RAERLRRERYETDAWRHQVHPGTDASGSVALRTPGWVVRCYVALVGTTIKSVLFAGDFNELPRSVTQFETALKWARFEADAVDRVGRAVFGDMTELGVPTEVLVQTVIRAGTRGRRLERAAPVRTAGSCYYPQTEGSRS
ncbi:MAG TPA: hypothetical protein VNE21_01565, partial [Mycobacteriales bacterium]|nr:hypothetical protein [Mycobacteriales bacterium]